MEFNILIIVSMLTAFVLALLSGVAYIDFLKKKMYTQYILEDAPERHAQKAGTPTTGGIFIVFSVIAASIAVLTMNQSLTTSALIVLITFIFFMLAGLTDDIGKIKHKKNQAGLKPRNKIFLQIVISCLPALYMTLSGQTYLNIGHFVFDIKLLYPVFAILYITGISNAVNLTDGLDGLASGNIAVSMLACAAVCSLSGHDDLAIIAAAAAGASVAFLYYNKYPAKVFMGDTGSLALGGLSGAIAVTGKFELWAVLISIVFCLETLSVIIQVASFKLTGKRVFKMSPVHHHFELCGWSENKIVALFSLITLIFSALTIILFKILW